MIYKLTAITLLAMLAGCGKVVGGGDPVNNPIVAGATVQKIAIIEGCAVYRLDDGTLGYVRYFSACGEVSGIESCGKNRTQDSSIQQLR